MTEVIWIILGIATGILLVVYYRTRNAVWGGFTLGIIIGFVLFIFNDFNLYFIGKGAVLGTMLGFGAELFGKLSDHFRG